MVSRSIARDRIRLVTDDWVTLRDWLEATTSECIAALEHVSAVEGMPSAKPREIGHACSPALPRFGDRRPDHPMLLEQRRFGINELIPTAGVVP